MTPEDSSSSTSSSPCSTFADLPEPLVVLVLECLTRVSDLARCAAVSKHLRGIVEDSVWRRTKLFDLSTGCQAPDRALRWACQRCSKLQMRSVHVPRTEAAEAAVCKDVCKVGTRMVIASLATCGQLEVLDLRGSKAELTAKLASALTRCPALRELWIQQARKEASNPLQTLLNRCVHLETLHIGEIFDYGGTIVRPRGPCAHLRHLHISNGELPLIMPEFLVALEQLDISHTSASSSIISAVASTTRLRSLNVSGCHIDVHIDDYPDLGGFEVIAPSGRPRHALCKLTAAHVECGLDWQQWLAELVLQGFSRCMLDEGADPGIVLDVSWSTITDADLDHMICVFQELRAAQMRLHRLPEPQILEGHPGHSLVCQNKVWWLTEPSSLVIGGGQPGYPWLTHLCLALCSSINISMMRRLASCKMASRLVHLDLDNMAAGGRPQMHPAAEQSDLDMLLAAQNGCLQVLKIGAWYVTDGTLALLASHSPNLMHLAMIGALGYTDAGLACVAQACRRLQTLEIGRDCEDWTEHDGLGAFGGLAHLRIVCRLRMQDEVFAHVMSRHPRLQSLTLTMCDQITDAGLAALPCSLESLSIIACNLIQLDGVQQLQRLTALKFEPWSYLHPQDCKAMTGSTLSALTRSPRLRRLMLQRKQRYSRIERSLLRDLSERVSIEWQ